MGIRVIGRCVTCECPSGNKVRCEKCNAKNREAGRRYRERHRKAGLCANCDQPLAPGSKSSCVKHLKSNNRRKGTKPWVKGGRGRPPLSAKLKEIV